MKELQMVALGLLVACSGTLAGAEELQSGLRPGDPPGAFVVKDITGPGKGTSLCYRCAFEACAVINIQTRRVTDEVVNLVKTLEGMVDSADELGTDSKHAFLVYLTDDVEAAAKDLETVAAEHKIKNIPLTIFDGQTGPPQYHIAQDAEVTVMMWKDHKVEINHAFAATGLDKNAVKKVVEDARRHLK